MTDRKSVIIFGPPSFIRTPVSLLYFAEIFNSSFLFEFPVISQFTQSQETYLSLNFYGERYDKHCAQNGMEILFN